MRILGLLTVPPVLLYDPAGYLHRIPQTRLGLALDPPNPPGRVTYASDGGPGHYPEGDHDTEP